MLFDGVDTLIQHSALTTFRPRNLAGMGKCLAGVARYMDHKTSAADLSRTTAHHPF